MIFITLQAVDGRDWSEVDVTSTQLAPGSVWYGKADLENLRPNTQYMVQVSSLNNEGYSKFSEISIFATPKEGIPSYKIISIKMYTSVSETYKKEAVSSSGISLLKSFSILTNLLVFSRVLTH